MKKYKSDSKENCYLKTWDLTSYGYSLQLRVLHVHYFVYFSGILNA